MEKDVLLMNFTGIYKEEDFYSNYQEHMIDFSSLQGCRMILSKEAKKIIQARIACEKVDAIHFIDSGDYHYITKLWIERIQKDFVLIVFDHHIDAQEDWMAEQITCANWISHIENRHLKKIVLIGPEEKNNPLYTDISEDSIEKADSLQEAKMLLSDLPVYISLDKDVLSKHEVDTNYDQGNMKKECLLEVISEIFEEDHVIGIDICGECESEIHYLQKIQQDNRLNLEILKALENEHS